MATLYLDHINRSIPCLRDWLDGHWGLLCSHPDDFEDRSLESDRWLQILRSEFGASGVKPIACRCSGGEPDRSWVRSVTADERRVRLTHHEVIDIRARRLRDAIVSVAAERFVLVVDPVLRRRAAWRYGPFGAVISPLALLSVINVMRRATTVRDEVGWHCRAA
jgi:hypothetical protein